MAAAELPPTYRCSDCGFRTYEVFLTCPRCRSSCMINEATGKETWQEAGR